MFCLSINLRNLQPTWIIGKVKDVEELKIEYQGEVNENLKL